MPLKSIITFLFFTLLSVYFSFLNPHEVEIHFSQAHSLRLPMVVLFLGSILLGVLIADLLYRALSLKTFFSNSKVAGRHKRQDSTNRRIGMLFEEAENFVACGYISKAIPIYEKILDLSPNHVGVLTRLGNTLREEGNPTRALELHLKAAQAAPKNLNVLYSLADDYLAKAMRPLEMKVSSLYFVKDASSSADAYNNLFDVVAGLTTIPSMRPSGTLGPNFSGSYVGV